MHKLFCYIEFRKSNHTNLFVIKINNLCISRLREKSLTRKIQLTRKINGSKSQFYFKLKIRQTCVSFDIDAFLKNLSQIDLIIQAFLVNWRVLTQRIQACPAEQKCIFKFLNAGFIIYAYTMYLPIFFIFLPSLWNVVICT